MKCNKFHLERVGCCLFGVSGWCRCRQVVSCWKLISLVVFFLSTFHLKWRMEFHTFQTTFANRSILCIIIISVSTTNWVSKSVRVGGNGGGGDCNDYNFVNRCRCSHVASLETLLCIYESSCVVCVMIIMGTWTLAPDKANQIDQSSTLGDYSLARKCHLSGCACSLDIKTGYRMRGTAIVFHFTFMFSLSLCALLETMKLSMLSISIVANVRCHRGQMEVVKTQEMNKNPSFAFIWKWTTQNPALLVFLLILLGERKRFALVTKRNVNAYSIRG